MESKKVFLFNLAVATLLLSLLAASARDPLLSGLLGGKRLRQCGLKCCDDCQCDNEMGYCTCWDWEKNRCTAGCRRCECDEAPPIYCRCADRLATCPRTCSSCDDIVGKARNGDCAQA